MSRSLTPTPLAEVLLVEDNEDDIELTRLAFKKSSLANRLHIGRGGWEGLQLLRCEEVFATRRRPDVVLLDFNMPRMDGREMLREMKRDPALKGIPVIVLTTSDADEDVQKAYELHANAYVTKPLALGEFIEAVEHISRFWFGLVKLPPDARQRPVKHAEAIVDRSLQSRLDCERL